MTTTAFSTHYSKKYKSYALVAKSWRVFSRHLIQLWCALFLLTPLFCFSQNQVEVNQLRLQRSEAGIFLSAQIGMELSPLMQETLLKGVPLHFVARANIFQSRWYWLDAQLIQARRVYRLTFQPLTRRWRLSSTSSTGKTPAPSFNQTFDSLSEAMRAITHIAQWRIASANDLSWDTTGRLEFDFTLDTTQLPKPFQLGALGQREWRLQVSRQQVLNLESSP